ncbi:MAG TPA: heme-binding domain-containing protein [Chitinophagaceae bacterium]|nr:heme-binding domain-containing protein [Chitinophagaceae bacterium]
MRKVIKRILAILLIAWVIIQFFRPDKNISTMAAPNDIATKYPVPANVQGVLKVACNDCHTDSSRYPWYWNIQPVAWFLDNHIREGKRHLDFSIFTSYTIARQYHLLQKINDEIKEGDMPLGSYTLIHRDAILNSGQKQAISDWVAAARQQIEANYPPDSLILPKRPQH